MKNKILFLFLFGLPLCLSAQSKETNRANEGEKVWIIINKVKAESKADYGKFMDEVFFDLLLDAKNPMMQKQYQHTRYLAPARQNKDQTWTFVFLMDAVVEGGNYEFLPLFMEKYSQEESEKLIAQYESFMAGPPEFHALVQTKH